MKIFLQAAFFCLIGLGTMASSWAYDINLGWGESTQIGDARVTCGYSSQPSESATSRTCGQEDSYGNCKYFDESTISGRHCATGDVCGREDSYGKCKYFNTVAACGDSSCSTSSTCGRRDSYGNCNYFNTTVSCR